MPRTRPACGYGEPARTRNVVLVGPAGTGKTTWVEALLTASGHRYEGSLALGVCSVFFDGTRVTLLDTPGHPELVGQVRAGLRAADAALFVLSASTGLDAATQLLWDECDAAGLPRAVVVTHLDSPRADYEAVVAICQRVLGAGVHPVRLPLLDDAEHPAGSLDLLTMRLTDTSGPKPAVRDADVEHREVTADARAALVEGIVSQSEDATLLQRYLAGEQLGEGLLVEELQDAVTRGALHPVLPAVPTTGTGVREVLELVVHAFPSPLEHPVPPVSTPDGSAREAVACDPGGPLVAEVVRATTDERGGRLALVRMYSGRLRPGTDVHVHRHLTAGSRVSASASASAGAGRVGQVFAPLGSGLSPLPGAVAGDVVVVELTGAGVGDTLGTAEEPALMGPWSLPEPALAVAVRLAETVSPTAAAGPGADAERLAVALGRLAAEDPTARLDLDAGTGQLVLWTMGETHLHVLTERLRQRTDLTVSTAAVQVALRERLDAAAAGRGCSGHAVCEVEVQPLPPGDGLRFVDAMPAGSLPPAFVDGVRRGMVEQIARGLVHAVPAADLSVRLVGGRPDEQAAGDAAARAAGAAALRDAASQAGTTVLEPVEDLRVVVGEEYLGAVLADLALRRGLVIATTTVRGGRTEVRAEVPAGELARYSPDLRSLAFGTGTFTRRYLRHGPVPAHLAARVPVLDLGPTARGPS